MNKLCKDCKFYLKLHDNDPSRHLCNRPTGNIDLVTGKPEYLKYNPDAQRSVTASNTSCGTIGQYFQPKEVEPSVKEKLINFFKRIKQD